MAVMKFITKNNPNTGFTEKYKDMDAYQTVIHYVFDPAKTNGVVGGWAVNMDHAAEQMKLATALYHKESGTKLRHWIVSFQVNEINNIALSYKTNIPCILSSIGYSLTSFYKDQYQIVFGIHWVRESSPHIHIVMNTTSYMDGKKFDGSHEQYHAYADYARAVLRQYGTDLRIMEDSANTKCL